MSQYTRKELESFSICVGCGASFIQPWDVDFDTGDLTNICWECDGVTRAVAVTYNVSLDTED